MENGKNKIKDFFLTVIVALLASTIVFYIWDVPEWLYFLVLLGVWLFFLLQFPVGKNIGLYSHLLACSISNSVVYFCITLWGLAKNQNDDVLFIIKALYGITDVKNNTELYLLGLFCIVAYVAIGRFVHCSGSQFDNADKIRETGTTKTLFVERHNDLNRLREYLNKFSIVGLNGDWGSGKSFLTDQLKDDFHMVKIDLLSCNLEEVQSLVISELDKVLKKEGVLSPFSPKIRKMLNQGGLLEKIGGLFIKDDVLFTEALEQFRKDLNQLPFRILIVFEDLDRVENPDVIKKIMGISEKLAGDNIRVLYQFSEEHLDEKGINRAYLEKYIPFTVNLTDIPFEKMVYYIFYSYQNKIVELRTDDFRFLNDLKILIGLETYEASFLANNIPIRKMEHFFEETNQALRESGEYCNNKRTVISFFILKHFCDQLYKRLEMRKSLLDMTLIHYKEQEMSYRELKRQIKDDTIKLWETMTTQGNQNAYVFFVLLDYHFSDDNSLERDLQDKKTDQIVSSLLGRGNPKLIESEYIIQNLFDRVLSASKEMQMKCFTFMHTDASRKGIFFRKEGSVLAEAMQDVEELNEIKGKQKKSCDEWMKFLDFIFRYNDKSYINKEWIQCLNYCINSYRSCYLYTLEQFNRLEIRYNFNGKAYYAKFLKQYLRQLSRLGFCNTEIVTLLDENKIDPSTCNDVFGVLEKDLSGYTSVDSPDLQRDLTIVRDFIKKNRQLIANETSAPHSEHNVNITFSSAPPPNEEEELGDIESDEDFQKQLERYYKEGKLKPYQVKRAWNKRKSKKN